MATDNTTSTTTEIRLCNCIPTIHLPNSKNGSSGGDSSAQQAVVATSSTSALMSPPPIGNRMDQLMTFQREVDVSDPFKSHSGIAEQLDASIEAKLDTIQRSESGF